jgi:hypothetical protein
VNHVSSFAEWWDEMDTILGNLKNKVDRLGGVKIPKIKMKGITRKRRTSMPNTKPT